MLKDAHPHEIRARVLSGEGASGQAAAEMAGLYREFNLVCREIDGVAEVRPVPGPPPPEGARGDATIVAAAIILTSAADALATLLAATRDWVQRKPGRRVEIKIGDDSLIIDGADGQEARRLVDLFVSRHSPSDP